MDIEKDLKKEYKKLENKYKKEKDPKKHPYDFYLKKKQCIDDYYDLNKIKLLNNEKVLIARRNYIYNNYVNDSVSTGVLLISVMISFISSTFYDVLLSNDDSFMFSYSKGLEDFIISFPIETAELGQIILAIIILLLLFLVPLIFIILILYFIVNKISKSIADKNFASELHECEFNKIETLLKQKYYNKKVIKVKVKTPDKNILDDVLKEEASTY